jgi:predicted glycoside hydrolase/deacetylase ChbG (UPF0249 family)
MNAGLGEDGGRSFTGLVVNADDYGYFPGVSEGILACARQGRITATGVMANRPWFEDDIVRLRDETDIDAGVHLVLTCGEPLTAALAARLPGGRFPSKESLIAAILRQQIPLELLRAEWCAQIERCLGAGLTLHFLNSHEHVHMLPSLFRLIVELADIYGIPHLRLSEPEWPPGRSPATFVRDLALAVLARIDRRRLSRPPLPLVGTRASGRLDLAALRRIFTRLRRGRIYELMCHPGFRRETDPVDPATAAYHDWDLETRSLCSGEFATLLGTFGVRLLRYRDLPSPDPVAATNPGRVAA